MPSSINRLRGRWGFKTMGARLVLGYALLFVGSTVVLAVLAYALFNHFMHEPDRSFMTAKAREMSEAFERGGIDALRRTLGGSASEERLDDLLVRLEDGEGRTVLLYNPDSWTVTEIAKLEDQSPPEAEAWIRLGPAEDDDALEAFVVRLVDGSVLQVGMDADIRQDALASMRNVFLVIAFPVLILALLGGALMAYRALRPVRDLVEILHAVIDTGDVKRRVPTEEVRGEFGDLVYLFNRMLDRIEALVIGMRGTLDDVAHDLRTPITRIRGKAELALQAERDPAAYREALADSLEETQAVTTMLDTIMDVAEAEAGTMSLNYETLNLRELVDDVVDLYQIVADDKGIALETYVRDDLTIVADRNRLRQVLANLIDNAVKYTEAGGRVAVAASEEGGETCMRVSDTGIGIDPDEQGRIWDRLYRGDRSRNERGLGLGLSLVRAIAEAHRGRVEVESSIGEGATFFVRLPR